MLHVLTADHYSFARMLCLSLGTYGVSYDNVAPLHKVCSAIKLAGLLRICAIPTGARRDGADQRGGTGARTKGQDTPMTKKAQR